MIKRAKYKNKDCYVISSASLSASIIPDPGAKVASLVDCASGYEHMAQRGGALYRDQPFDGVYVDGECTGFDDMFPTIDECHYELAPWKGARLADHGEVWSLPWQHEVKGESIRLRVRGVRLPYLLEKTVSMPSERTLRLDYALTNDTDFPMDYLWAAHVMANIDEGTRVLLPRCCRTAMTTLSRSGRMGRYGDAVPWPSFTAPDGTPHRADIARPAAVSDNEKYYFRDPLDEGWCAVRAPGGRLLALSFPVETVPYLGILMNEHAFDDRYNIFLEPCSAPFDRPDVARLRGQGSIVKAHSQVTWHLCMTVDTLAAAEELSRVTGDGAIVKAKGSSR
jgi:hypothetical protein